MCGVQFNFVPPEEVPPSCTPLGNAGEAMVVGLERSDQFSPKSHALFKFSIGLSSISVKKDSFNLPMHKFGGQRLVSCLPNVIPAESKLSSLQNSMEIKTRIENKNKEQRKNKLGLMSFIKCIPKAKKNKRKFMLFCSQMDPKNKTSFVQKQATNNLQLFTIRKHTQNSSVFLLTNKTTKSTKPTITIQHPLQVHLLAIHDIH